MKNSQPTYDSTKVEARLMRLNVAAKKALDRSEALSKDAIRKFVLYEKAAKALVREAKAEQTRSSTPTVGRPNTGEQQKGQKNPTVNPKNAAANRSRNPAQQAAAPAPKVLAAKSKGAKPKKIVSSPAGRLPATPSLEGHLVDEKTPSAMDLPSLDATLAI